MRPPMQIHTLTMHSTIPPSASRPTSESQTDSDREEFLLSKQQANQALLFADAAAESNAEL